jgi:hypothetical protein
MSALLGLLDKSHTWRHFATIYKALEQIKAIHSWVQLWLLLLLFDDRRSQNDNNDYYDDGDINIIVYTESFMWLKAGIDFYLQESVLSFFLIFYFQLVHKLFWKCDSRMINMIVEYCESLHYKIKHSFYPRDLFETIYAVLAIIIPKCVPSAKQVLCICLVSLCSEEMGEKREADSS